HGGHQAKDLVYKMLTVATDDRATLPEVLNHPVRGGVRAEQEPSTTLVGLRSAP
ncbi:unnamed protein product, partial [Hapterophycus canaliculatus]